MERTERGGVPHSAYARPRPFVGPGAASAYSGQSGGSALEAASAASAASVASHRQRPRCRRVAAARPFPATVSHLQLVLACGQRPLRRGWCGCRGRVGGRLHVPISAHRGVHTRWLRQQRWVAGAATPRHQSHRHEQRGGFGHERIDRAHGAAHGLGHPRQRRRQPMSRSSSQDPPAQTAVRDGGTPPPATHAPGAGMQRRLAGGHEGLRAVTVAVMAVQRCALPPTPPSTPPVLAALAAVVAAVAANRFAAEQRSPHRTRPLRPRPGLALRRYGFRRWRPRLRRRRMAAP